MRPLEDKLLKKQNQFTIVRDIIVKYRKSKITKNCIQKKNLRLLEQFKNIL